MIRALFVGTILLTGACQPHRTRIHIQDFSRPNAPRSLYQDFDEAYYQLDAAGSLQLLLRREVPSEAIPTENITQIIRAETFWRPIPGTTYVERTMINAKLTYLIQSGRTARAYRGTGFISFKERSKGELLTGKIESGVLKPTAEWGNPPQPFDKVHLQGTFRAIHKPRRATAVLTDMNRTLQEMTPVQSSRSNIEPTNR